MKTPLVVAMALMLSGCSSLSLRTKCALGYGAAGAGAGALLGVVGPVVFDCGSKCQQQKLKLGEIPEEALSHHLEQRDKLIEIAAPAGFVLGGLGGFLGAYETICKGAK